MILTESVQEDIIIKFKNLMQSYENFKQAAKNLDHACFEVKDLEFDSKYLYDFISEEMYDRLKNMKESILDVYYPLYDDSSEENDELASEKYHDSVEQREEVFKDYF